jgi:hypothetical protein
MIKEHTVTIANGQTASSAANLEGRTLVGARFPTMTGTSATIQEGATEAGAVGLGTEGGAISITSPSGRSVRLSSLMIGCRFVKLTSGGAEAGERTITLLSEDYTA